MKKKTITREQIELNASEYAQLADTKDRREIEIAYNAYLHGYYDCLAEVRKHWGNGSGLLRIEDIK